MESIKKNILLILCGTIFLFCLMGCTSKKDTAIQIGVMIYRYDDNFMSLLKQAIERKSSEYVRINMNDSENNQEYQKEQITDLVAKNVDALAINIVDTQQAADVIELVKDKNVPVIFFNREPDLEILNSYDQCWYVGTDSKQAGKIQGEIVSESWIEHPEWDLNQDGRIQCVILKGEQGHPDAELRTRYVVETIFQQGIEIEVLDIENGDWDSLNAKEIMDTWLDTYPRIEYVISNNDAMALGAIASLQNHGYYNGSLLMPIVGVDGIPEILSKIENGLVVGTVLNDSLSQGNAIVDIASNIATGKNPVEGTDWEVDVNKAIRIPYIAITKENIELVEKSYEE